MNKRRKEKVIEKPYKKKLIKRRKPNRSIVGDFFYLSGTCIDCSGNGISACFCNQQFTKAAG